MRHQILTGLVGHINPNLMDKCGGAVERYRKTH